MTTKVMLQSRPGTESVWLEVTYDGTDPPRALFDDLEMIGWTTPTTPPPPRTAIDWTTPDPSTGERYTLRSWLVEAALVEPPAGSGPRGAWTAEERPAYLLALDGVLRRHALSSEPRVRCQPTATLVLLAEPSRRAAIEAVLAAAAVDARLSPATVTVIRQYRGSPYEVEVPALRFDVDLPGDAIDPVIRDLADAAGIDERDPERLRVTQSTASGPHLSLVTDDRARLTA
jgi:hypothetical protein